MPAATPGGGRADSGRSDPRCFLHSVWVGTRLLMMSVSGGEVDHLHRTAFSGLLNSIGEFVAELIL